MAVHPEGRAKVTKPVSETRKVRKPLMERRRRERINNSLEQLAVLLKEANLVAKDKPVAKLEKADILELTVRHIRGFRGSSAPKKQQLQLESQSQSVESDHDHQSLMADKHDNELTDHSSSEDEGISDFIDDNKSTVKSNSDQSDVSSHSNVDISSSAVKDFEEGKLVIDESAAVASTISETNANEKKSPDNTYMEGFYECLHEVKQATRESGNFEKIKARLVGHLESCMETLSAHSKNASNNNSKICKGVKRKLQEIKLNNPDDIEKKIKVDQCQKSSSPPPSAGATSSNTAMTGLTLVPMRMADGAVAYLLQGDANSDVLKSVPASLVDNTSESSFVSHASAPSMAVNITDNKSANLRVLPNTSSNISIASNLDADVRPLNVPQNKLPIPAIWRKSCVSKFVKNNSQNIIPKTVDSSIQSNNTTRQSFMSCNNVRPLSINVNGTQGIISSSKIMPKVKTVTLPVGTVAPNTTYNNISSTHSKPLTMFNNTQVLNNTLHNNSIVMATNMPPSSLPRQKYIKIMSKPSQDALDKTVTISIPETSNIITSNVKNISSLSHDYNPQSHSLNGYNNFQAAQKQSFAGQNLINRAHPDSHLPNVVSPSNDSPYSNGPTTSVYPPTPPPSVSLPLDQWAPKSPVYESHNNSQCFPNTQQTYTLLSASPISSCSHSTTSPRAAAQRVLAITTTGEHRKNDNNCVDASVPPQSNITGHIEGFVSSNYAKSLSLVSSSVELLGGSIPSSQGFNQTGDVQNEDEFIDVENDPQDHLCIRKYNSGAMSLNVERFQNDNYDETGDMWRPW